MKRADQWAETVVRYWRWERDEDAAVVLQRISLCEPDKYAPAEVWIAWHEVQAECWSRLAARDSMFDWHEKFIGGYHREEACRLTSGQQADRAAVSRRDTSR